jgi:Protein of unknown function (DUF3467)
MSDTTEQASEKTNGSGAHVTAAAAARSAPERSRMRVDTSDLKSSYCNVCNGSSTREEVVLNFGVNHDWDRGEADYDIRLLHRIVLSPFAAKRVATLLTSIVADYEKRHGVLK